MKLHLYRFVFRVSTAAFFFAIAACVPNEAGNVASGRDEGEVPVDPAPHERFDAALSAACPAGVLAAAESAPLTRRPYLQQVTPRGAYVVWAGAQSASVQLWESSAPDDLRSVAAKSAAAPDGQQYEARLDGLEASSLYCYEVGDSAAAWTQPLGFRTAPASTDSRVQLVAFGDVGESTSDQEALVAQLVDVPFELALLTGDIAYGEGTYAQLETHYFGEYAELMQHVPFYPASGNHDLRTDNGDPFRDVFVLPENGGPDGIERWYSFDWGPLHLVALDTEKVGATQAEWLDRDLASTDRPWTIVYLHKPPYSSGYHGSSNDVRGRFGPIFDAHGVDLVLAGHDHDYERTEPINGVTYIVTGGGGVGTRPVGNSWFTAYSEAVIHFVHITADAHELRIRAVDATGRTFDGVDLLK